MVNVIVLRNTIYMDAVLDQLRAEGFDVRPEDVARLLPLGLTTSTCLAVTPSSCRTGSHVANSGHCAIPATPGRDCRKIGGQAAIAIGEQGSLAGWNFCPKPEPSVLL